MWRRAQLNTLSVDDFIVRLQQFAELPARGNTVKFVAGVLDTDSSPVWMFMTPTPKPFALPVSRVPTSMGMTRLLLRPIRRL